MFRFLEFLLPVGCVAGLAFFGLPLLASAKENTARQGELDQIRRLSTAQGLYMADNGGVAMSTLPLVDGGYVKRDVCSSPLDKADEGTANAITRELATHSRLYADLAAPYRNSYVGIREYHFPYRWMKQYVLNQPGAGWLVSLSESKQQRTDTGTTWYSGTYRRLMLDGSVQIRHHEPVQMKIDGQDVRAEHDLFLFTDGSLEWKRSFISGSR